MTNTPVIAHNRETMFEDAGQRSTGWRVLASLSYARKRLSDDEPQNDRNEESRNTNQPENLAPGGELQELSSEDRTYRATE
jgi:hypothetical protein